LTEDQIKNNVKKVLDTSFNVILTELKNNEYQLKKKDPPDLPKLPVAVDWKQKYDVLMGRYLEMKKWYDEVIGENLKVIEGLKNDKPS
jgi:hypothetical protein